MPIGLLAVIGPSKKEKRGPPRFWATSRGKTCSRSQNSRVVRAMATKSSGPGVVNILASRVWLAITRVPAGTFRGSTRGQENETAARNPDGREVHKGWCVTV